MFKSLGDPECSRSSLRTPSFGLPFSTRRDPGHVTLTLPGGAFFAVLERTGERSLVRRKDPRTFVVKWYSWPCFPGGASFLAPVPALLNLSRTQYFTLNRVSDDWEY